MIDANNFQLYFSEEASETSGAYFLASGKFVSTFGAARSTCKENSTLEFFPNDEIKKIKFQFDDCKHTLPEVPMYQAPVNVYLVYNYETNKGVYNESLYAGTEQANYFFIKDCSKN